MNTKPGVWTTRNVPGPYAMLGYAERRCRAPADSRRSKHLIAPAAATADRNPSIAGSMIELLPPEVFDRLRVLPRVFHVADDDAVQKPLKSGLPSAVRAE